MKKIVVCGLLAIGGSIFAAQDLDPKGFPRTGPFAPDRSGDKNWGRDAVVVCYEEWPTPVQAQTEDWQKKAEKLATRFSYDTYLNNNEVLAEIKGARTARVPAPKQEIAQAPAAPQQCDPRSSVSDCLRRQDYSRVERRVWVPARLRTPAAQPVQRTQPLSEFERREEAKKNQPNNPQAPARKLMSRRAAQKLQNKKDLSVLKGASLEAVHEDASEQDRADDFPSSADWQRDPYWACDRMQDQIIIAASLRVTAGNAAQASQLRASAGVAGSASEPRYTGFQIEDRGDHVAIGSQFGRYPVRAKKTYADVDSGDEADDLTDVSGRWVSWEERKQ